MTATHPVALLPGMTVGPWRILAQLGSGAFGIVFQVEHEGQVHALKFALRGPGSDDLNHTDARATKELACLLQAAHPNVVRVWAHGRWPDARTGYHFVVMDFVEGDTLAGWVKRERPSARRVASLFARLARALGQLHARDVFHRDLKPSNILVRAVDEEPILVDFGSADHAESLPLTEGALPPGTPQYRTPEALRFHREHHARPDAHYPFRATDDLYALGVTLYEVLAGKPAFSPTLPRDILIEHIEERLPPLPSAVNPRVPAALEAIVLRLLRKRARERFAHGEALYTAFEEALRTAGPEWDEPLFSPGPMKEPSPEPPARQTPAGVARGPAPASHHGPASARVRPPGRSALPSSSPARAPRPASWLLLGAGALLALLAVLGWKRSGPPSTQGQLQAPVPPPGTAASVPTAPEELTGEGGTVRTDAPLTDAGGDVERSEPSLTTREETVTKPTTPGATRPAAAPPGPGKRALPVSLAGMAAAASLHCVSTPRYATPVGEKPRRNEPCSPVALSSMNRMLKEYHGAYGTPYSFPLVGSAQLDVLQDYVDGHVLVGGLRTGFITSVVRDSAAFPNGTTMDGWVWVDGEDAEIQWVEARLPRTRDTLPATIPICARAGNKKRHKLANAPGSTPKNPRWYRSDEYTVVDRW
ncbi:serine/threonine protein kinase [Pyxidicoccus sp. 3LG]